MVKIQSTLKTAYSPSFKARISKFDSREADKKLFNIAKDCFFCAFFAF
jgi:hypothetical protein